MGTVVRTLLVGLLVAGGAVMLAVSVVPSDGGGRPTVAAQAQQPDKVSVVDRPAGAQDGLTPDIAHLLAVIHPPVVPGSLRLALDAAGTRVYVGKGTRANGDLCVLTADASGHGITCGPPVFEEHGANMTVSESTVIGLVPDHVTSVDVNGAPAVMGENVFLAEGNPDATVVLHGADGDRTVRAPRPPAETPRGGGVDINVG